MRGHLQRLLRDKGLLALLPCCATILWIAGAAIAAGNGGNCTSTKCGCVVRDQSGNPTSVTTDACCDAALVPGVQNRVAKWGTCEAPGCNPTHPNCVMGGTLTKAQTECEK